MKRHSDAKPYSQAGFTLIEVLVVVIIVGILAGITGPAWLGFLNRQRVGAVRSDLTAAIKGAQQEAIQRRQTVTLVFSNTNGVPTMSVNGVPQALGGNRANQGNVQITSYSVNPTTGTKTTLDTLQLDYQGLPVAPNALPFVISINTAGSTVKQCVIVSNLLGSLKTAQNTECDNPKL